MMRRHRKAAPAAAALAALALTLTTGSAADALCTQADLTADRTLGPMVGFLPAPPATAADRATANSRLHEFRAMIAPYRHGGGPPRDIARYAAAGMLVPVQSRPALAERGPRILLYRASGGGAMQLEAMEFVLPNDTPVAELNAVLPLSIARWHQTTYHCKSPPRFMWAATVFPYARGDGAIWRTLEVPKYVEIAPRYLRRERSAPRASR